MHFSIRPRLSAANLLILLLLSACAAPGQSAVSYTHLTLPTNREV